MVSQRDRIADLLDWYGQHRDAIAAVLPLTHQGTTHLRLEPLDRDIESYRAGQLNRRFAYCYVRRPLERLKAAFNEHLKEVQSGE